MLKLLKYEFRKALVPLLVMLGITAVLEVYYLIALYTAAEEGLHLVISILLLVLMTAVADVFVMIRGVTSYSGELKSRSAYLIYMTPNSTRKIIGSKFLFTYLIAALFTILYAVLGALDIGLLLNAAGEFEEFIEVMKEAFVALEELGLHLEQFIFAGIFAVIYMSLTEMSFFAVAYLAITLSHTLFRDKKWRWAMALLFFVAITYGINFISSLFPMAYSMLHFMDAPGVNNITAAYGIDTTPDFTALLVYVIPQALVSLAAILVSFFGCSFMLEKKVSL